MSGANGFSQILKADYRLAAMTGWFSAFLAENFGFSVQFSSFFQQNCHLPVRAARKTRAKKPCPKGGDNRFDRSESKAWSRILTALAPVQAVFGNFV